MIRIFARAIDNAHASNSTTVTYDFTSMVDPNHPHRITIGGKALSDLYTSIRNAVRNNQALARLYPNLAA